MKWVYRIASGISGLVFVLAAAIWLLGTKSLPDCDTRKTFDTVREAVASMVPPAAANGATQKEMKGLVTLDDETEISYDKKAEVRVCTGTVSLTVKDKTIIDKMKINYTIVWTDKDEGMFKTTVKRID